MDKSNEEVLLEAVAVCLSALDVIKSDLITDVDRPWLVDYINKKKKEILAMSDLIKWGDCDGNF